LALSQSHRDVRMRPKPHQIFVQSNSPLVIQHTDRSTFHQIEISNWPKNHTDYFGLTKCLGLVVTAHLF
jgi:hypothetical protein